MCGISNNEMLDENGEEQEHIGIAACKYHHSPFEHLSEKYGRWIQCSYNHKIRGMQPQVGSGYCPVDDVFYPPKPYPSWVRDRHRWLPPTPYPDTYAPGWPEGGMKGWEWDEESLSWIAMEFPFIFDEEKQEWILRNE